MIEKVLILALALVAVSADVGNPAADKPWAWKSPQPQITPREDDFITKIVGGQEATPHEYPFQVALFIGAGFFCGGSLISDQWILTAAHCMSGQKKATVILGAHNLRKHEESQQSIHATHFVVHENWNSYRIQNDIALIKLPHPVEFNEFISPAKLADTDQPVGTLHTATGWGKYSDSVPSTSPYLREVSRPSITVNKCAAYFGSIVTHKQICIDTKGGHGACNGDSGGPLSIDGTVYGLTSFGSRKCESGFPAVFTRVSEFRGWIRKHTGI